MSIFSKLFRLFIAVVLLPLIPMALLLGYYQHRQKASILENHYNLAEIVSSELPRYTDSLQDHLYFAAELSPLLTEPALLQAELQKVLTAQPDLLVLSVIRPDGEEVANALQPATGVEGGCPAEFKQQAPFAPSQLHARLTHTDGTVPSLEFIYPLGNGYGLYGRQALLTLAERLSQMRIGRTGQVYLTATNGEIYAGPYQWNPGVQAQDLAAHLGQKNRVLIKSIQGQEGALVGAVSSEPRLGMYVIVLQPKEEALRSFYFSTAIILLFVLSIAMLAYFGALAFSRSLGDPIALLMQGAKEISHGNLDYHIKEEVSWKEFQELIASFNKMTADLKDYQALQLKNQVSEMKEQVFRAVAHDLRAPLMGLQGYIYLLSGEQLTETERKEYLQRMTEAAQNLSSLLEDVLAVSRVESGVALPQRERVQVAPLVQSVVHTQQPLAREKGLQLVCQVSEELAAWADPKLLRRIISNLVSNAVKFTTQGSIIIAAGETEEDVWISVQDSGPGLSAEQQQHIFEKFHQVDGQAEGYGLGLFISRQLARAHGGELSVQSKTGEGSTFTVRLPKEEK